MTTLSQADLVNLLIRTSQRDRDAFTQLYRATSAKIFGIVLGILRQRALADEVVQEVYLSIWQSAGSFDKNRSSPITWMAVIARNRALDEFRRPKFPVTDSDYMVESVPDAAALPLEIVAGREELSRLTSCLDRLEPDKKQLVVMAYLEGRSGVELAALLGHPAATIRTWLHRSVQQLKDCMGR